MTTFDRFEREIPALMAELAPARVPDYLDDMLHQAARTRQRPAWSALERWLPMGVIARSQQMRPLPWRPIVVLALLAMLVVGGAILYVGSQTRLPAPFGPAANGLLFIATGGDIATIDPITGATSVIIAGSDVDTSPWVSHDGRRVLFARAANGGPEALFVANIDGTGVRQLTESSTVLSWYDWSPDDTQVLVTYEVDGRDALFIVDLASGATRMLAVPVSVFEPSWRPNGREIVFRGDGDGSTDGLYLVQADGTGLRPILPTTSGGSDDWRRPSLSPDGNSIAFDRWEESGDVKGRIHVVDVDSGLDRRLALGGDDETVEGQPVWSPNGSRLAFLWFPPGDAGGFHVTTAPVADGPPTIMGPAHMGDLDLAFSPDGRQVMATYKEDGTTWLFDVATGDGRQVDWPIVGGWAWQRLAP